MTEENNKPHVDSVHWDWVDDLEYLLKVLLMVLFACAGIFGETWGVEKEIRQELILGGTLGTALISRQRNN